MEVDHDSTSRTARDCCCANRRDMLMFATPKELSSFEYSTRPVYNKHNSTVHTLRQVIISTMEQLLSTSFDLLSSYDPLHVRKGLRCLEGFLAKMCLQTPAQTPAVHPREMPRKETRLMSASSAVSTRPCDAAFEEFVRLQSGFEWNGASSLLSEWRLSADRLQ